MPLEDNKQSYSFEQTKTFFKSFVEKIKSSLVLKIVLCVVILLIIGLVVWLLIPSKEQVTFIFKSDNIQLVESFDFSVNVNGNTFDGKAIKGKAILELPVSDKLSLESISIKKYAISKSEYDFSDTINVSLNRIYKMLPTTIFLFDESGITITKTAHISFNCDSTELGDAQKERNVSSGSTTINVPENCGILGISVQIDGYKVLSGETCDSTSCVVTLGLITQVLENQTSLPAGSIKVTVYDVNAMPVSGAKVSIFDAQNQKEEIDKDTTNDFGNTKLFTNLPVGNYIVYASKEDYLDTSQQIKTSENKVNNIVFTLENTFAKIVSLSFVDENNVHINGNSVLKDNTGKIVFKGTTSNGAISIPVSKLDNYFLDFEPDSNSVFALANNEIQINSSFNEKIFTLKTKTLYNSVKVNVKVLDEDNLPIEGAKVFVIDPATQFELLSLDNFPATDKNGLSTSLLQIGSYQFRVYNGFNEAYSNTVVLSGAESDKIPELDVNIVLPVGYSMLKLKVTDESNNPKSNALVTFYKKPLTESGSKILSASGETTHSFKAGTSLYYIVKADNYLPYYSESRLLMTNYNWQSTVSMVPLTQAEPKVDFLGIFSDFEGAEEPSLNIGGIYYLGFKIYMYESKPFEFKLNVGDDQNLDAEKLSLIDAYTSANYDLKYLDSKMEQNTIGKAKIISSFWNETNPGVYNVYYKVKVKNDGSVKILDSLKISWDLLIDDISVASEIKEFLAGASGVCTDNDFCSRYTLLNKSTNLYLESQGKDQFLVSPNTKYEFAFDLTNNLSGPDNTIKNGTLQIFNAQSQKETLSFVENDVSSHSFIRLLNYNLKGPTDNKSESLVESFGVFVKGYQIKDYIKNRYISGQLGLQPVILGESFLNFVVLDNDKKMVINNKSALSVLFKSTTTKKLNLTVFPEKILAPGIQQNLSISVSDDTNSFVKDALVTVKIKKPTDTTYFVLGDCRNIKTDLQGKADCLLPSLPPGTLVQILVEKEGYESYSQKDFTPDLQVTTKILGFDKEKLSIDLIYPTDKEGYDSLIITNNSASTLKIESVDLQVDNYSLNLQNFLNIDVMKAYLSNTYVNKEIQGIQLNYDSVGALPGIAKLELEDFFKAVLNDNISAEIGKGIKFSGAVKVTFRTQDETINRLIPFEINIVSQGYPTNADDGCLEIALNTGSESTSFATDVKPITIPLSVLNTCVVQSSSKGYSEPYPVVFDSAYLVLLHDSGSLGIGSFSFSLSTGTTNLKLSVPEIFAVNWKADLDNPFLGAVSFVPKGIFGREHLKAKIFAFVNTSDGLKKVESKELKFDVSVLHLEDCLKVFDDKGKEITETLVLSLGQYTPDSSLTYALPQDKFKLTFKNICEGITLDIMICKANDKEIPIGCGENVGNEYTGFKFDNASLYKGFVLSSKENELEISRPQVSGAYALEIFAKQLKDLSYKRIKILPVNVQTSYSNGLFSENPFLDIHVQTNNELNNKLFSDTLLVYNTNIPSSLFIADVNNFVNLLQIKNKNSQIYLGDLDDLVRHGSSTDILGAVVTRLVGWLIGAGVLLVGITIFIAAFTTYLNDDQEYKFVILNDLNYPDVNVTTNTIKIREDGTANYSDIFKITGQDHYQFLIAREVIKGHVGCKGWFCTGSKHWDDSIKFSLTCSQDYVVDTEHILWSDPKLTLSEDDCLWDKNLTVSSGKTVTFYPKCGGGSFNNIKWDTYVVVPCKLKSELWGRANQGEIIGGYPGTGMFKATFTNLDLNTFYNGKPCNSEWCYKTYPIDINSGVLGDGHLLGNIRVAFHNITEKEVSFKVGQACTNVSGDVVGFTGPDAKPKLQYKWDDSIDENFCSPDVEGNVKQYCDSTQLLISGLKRLKFAQSLLGEFSGIKCQMIPDYKKVDKESTINYFQDPGLSTNFFDKIDVGIKDGYWTITLDKNLGIFLTSSNPPQPIPQYKVYATDSSGKKVQVNYRSEGVPIDVGTNLVYLNVEIPLVKDLDIKDLNSGYNQLYDNTLNITVTLFDASGNEKIVSKMDFDLNLFAKVLKSQCLSKNPTTFVSSDGKMNLFTFLPSINENNKNQIFAIQDLLHYKVYLADDGYSKDFLKDFKKTYLETEFADNVGQLIKDTFLDNLFDNNRIIIYNGYTKNQQTNGSGLYEVHFNIVYPELSFDLNNAFVMVVLKKIASVTNDSVFYYLPIDGRVGVENGTIDRQGYGSDFTETSDLITINSASLNNQMLSNYNTTSNPKAHLNVSKDIDFKSMNSESERGTILNMSVTDTIKNEMGSKNDIKMQFVPNVTVNKFSYEMRNEEIEKETALYYQVKSVGGYELVGSSVLPWFVSDNTQIDFTGQYLYDNYPSLAKDASLESSGFANTAKISYASTNVTEFAKYDIYTYVYGKSGDNISLEPIEWLNLQENDFKNKQINLSISDINTLLNEIEEGKLCISTNKLDAKVFVNELANQT